MNFLEQLSVALKPLQPVNELADWWNGDGHTETGTGGVGSFNEELYKKFQKARLDTLLSDEDIERVIWWKRSNYDREGNPKLLGKFNWKLYEQIKLQRSAIAQTEV